MTVRYFLYAFFIIISAYLTQIPANAQDAGAESYQQRYVRAKALYEQGKYDLAIDILRPLSREEKGNPYVRYASFFYAMAAFQTEDYNLAKNMFLQIKDKYPRWKRMPEVNYGLANTYYELESYDQAFAMTAELTTGSQPDDQLREDASDMKQYYIAQTPDSILRTLLVKFPDEKAIAEQLVTNLTYSVYSEENIRYKDSLVQAYSIDLSELGIASQAASVRKEVYHVAAFLPFFQNKLTTSSLTDNRVGNQFILELYRGMELASKDLQKEGINVQLHAYDTEREYDVTKRLLSEEEIEYMDAFIGPLYQGPVKAVSEYALKNQVYMFNPLSANPQIIGDNPFSYLLRPSSATEAKMAARYALDSLQATRAVVVTGPTKRDSARVFTFIENFQADSDRPVYMEVIEDYNEETMDTFVEKLVEMSEEGETVVYVASDQELVITNTISALVMSAAPLKVIGSESWFDFTTISYEQLEDLGTYLLSPVFLDYSNPKIREFKQRYRDEYYTLPSKNVFIGYDTMYFLGQMLNEYGIYFQEFFTDSEPVPSVFFKGYNYFQANDNQVVPVLHFENGSLILSSSN
uniref:ABC transporter substrate-binding protein n=1 Tax=Roseihalotalea indica TaxID=2867963 RepID=A0AA49JGG4_9BACT|nr:ABC transporter substrate-binding protein [Tunicatimonas sp. TK19036]